MKRIIPLFVLALISVSCKTGMDPKYRPHLSMISPKSASMQVQGLPMYNLEKNRIGFTLLTSDPTNNQTYATDPLSDRQVMSLVSNAENPSTVAIPDNREYVRDAFLTFVFPGEEHVRKELEQARTYMMNYYISVRDLPTIIADDVLFGREPGADLSDLFLVCGYSGDPKDPQPVIKRDGESLQLQNVSGNCSFSDYYTTGTLVKYQELVYTKYFPEEIKAGKEINLTITIPVTEEYLWEYAIARAQGKLVDKEYADKTLQATVALKVSTP